MIVECSSCHARYNVDESKIPEAGVKVRCHKCQRIVFIKRPAVAPVKPSEPVAPPIRPSPPVTPKVEKPAVEVPTEVVKPTPPPAPPPPSPKPIPVIPAEVSKPVIAAPPEPPIEPQIPAPPPTKPVDIPKFEAPLPEAPAEIPKPAEPEIPRAAEAAMPKPPEPELPADAERVAIETVRPAPPGPELSDEDKKWHERANRLAKALASDLVLYNRDKVEQGLRDGTLAKLLGMEIRKSWEYYCQQIPKQIIESSDYFKDQLNKIVGKGKQLFK